MQIRLTKPQFQTPNNDRLRGWVQPLEHFRGLRVFILQNLPAPLESGSALRHIGELAGWRDLFTGRMAWQPAPNKRGKSVTSLL
jgi:hypothetical protein